MTFPSSLLLPSTLLFPSSPTDVIPSGRDIPFVTLGGYLFENRPGVTFTGQNLTGWDEATGTSLATVQKTRGPGAWRSNAPQRPARIVVYETLITTDTAQRMGDVIDVINALCTLDETLLQVDQHGVPRMALVSMQDKPAVTKYPSKLVKKISLQLVAADARKFGLGMQASTLLPSVSGGLTLPVTLPFTLGTTVVSGTCSLTNPAGAGQPSGRVFARVDGPCVAPQITHVSDQGSTVWVSPAALLAGQWLDVDFDGHTARVNGTALRPVSSRNWPGFDPGVNAWTFAAASPNPAAKLSLVAYPAWA